MRYKALLLLLLAVVFGGIAAYLVNSTLSKKLAEQADLKPLKVSTVVVAATDLPVGTALEPAMLRLTEWPSEALPDGSFATVQAALEKQPAVVMQEMRRGDIVLAHRLAAGVPRLGLTVKVPDGMRAASIAVNEIRGVGGFIHPGDRVDVLHTSTIQRGDQMPVTRTLLQDLVVLAVDQESADSSVAPKVSRVVTVLVTPEDAKKLALAQSIGDISLALRNEGDRLVDESALVSTGNLWVGQTIATQKVAPKVNRVQVIRGLHVKQETVAPGAPTAAPTPPPAAASGASPND